MQLPLAATSKFKLQPMLARWSPAGLPLRIHLSLFAALLIVPAILLSTFLIREAGKERRREAEARIVQLAADLADDISNEIERSLTILRTLSISQSLARDDFEAFHQQSKAALGKPDAAILLVEPDGRQLLNTAVPWGSALVPYSAPEALKYAVETKQPYVTDLFWGRVRNAYVINILLPILDADRPPRVLAYSITPEHVRQMLDGQDIGGEWTTGVSDRRGQLIARSREHERYVGKVLGPELIETGARDRAPHLIKGIDGRSIIRAVVHTRVSDWMVAASVTEAYLDKIVADGTRDLMFGTVIIMGIATLLVFLYGRQLADALNSIASASSGVARDTIIREATEAAHTLAGANESLRRSEQRFRGIYQNAATGIAITAPNGRYQSCNPAYAQMLGYSEAQLRDRSFEDLIHPDDRDTNLQFTQDLLEGRRNAFEIENRYLAADGRTLWVHKHVSMMRDSDGQPLHVIVLVTDRTERLKQERELAIAVERSKIAQQSARAAPYEYVPRTRQVLFDASIFTLAGFTQAEATALGDGRRALIHPDDATAASEAMDRGVAERMGYEVVYRMRHKDGRYVWVQDRASILRGQKPEDDRVIGMMLDISEQKAREEHINLLLREVNHRSKNMLGLVQAIARQTATADRRDFLARFSERIQALAANQDLLVRNDWQGVDIQDLISAQLAHFASSFGARISTGGPHLRLSPASAQVLGMVLHELATNASKYGALSGDKGRIDVRWRTSDGRFFITWRERDGPQVTPPAQEGFGSTVIRNMSGMSLDADVTLEYAASGLCWTLSCPLAKLVDAPAVQALVPQRAADAPAVANRKRILVVEDEALIAMEIADILSSEGYEIVGPARTVEQALALFRRHGCDMGVLDVNLGTQTAEPIARELAEHGTPFVLVSGYDRNQQPQALRASPLVTKPIRPQLLIAEIQRAIAARAA